MNMIFSWSLSIPDGYKGGKIYLPRSPEFVNTADNIMVQGRKKIFPSLYTTLNSQSLFTLKGIKQIPKEHGCK